MRVRNHLLPPFLLALTLAVPALEAGAATAEAPAQPKPQPRASQPQQPQAQAQEDDRFAARFLELDRDKNGFVSRAEWPLSPESFDIVDRDKNGRLSRGELLTPNQLRDDRVARRFDTDRNGRLSRRETRRGGAALGTRPPADVPTRVLPQEQNRFRDLDRNRDSRLSRLEWSGSPAAFNRLDRNRDGFVTLIELDR